MYNVWDFVQILYFAHDKREQCVSDREITCPPFFYVYYCHILTYFFTCLDTIPQNY